MRQRILSFCLLAAAAVAAFGQEPGQRPFVARLFAYGFIFQIAAIIHWSRKRPDTFWIWIIIIGGFIGALAYFLIEGLPDLGRAKVSISYFTRRKRMRQLRAMILDNPSAGNHEELGELLMTEGRFAEARQCFDHAIASRTDLLDSFYRRGICAFEIGDFDKATRDFEHVVKSEPRYDYSRAQCYLARSLAAGGRAAEAAAAFERLIETSTSPEAHYTAAAFFAESNRSREAAELVDRILARHVTMPAYQKRRDRQWLRKARALQRKLRRARPDSRQAA